MFIFGTFFNSKSWHNDSNNNRAYCFFGHQTTLLREEGLPVSTRFLTELIDGRVPPRMCLKLDWSCHARHVNHDAIDIVPCQFSQWRFLMAVKACFAIVFDRCDHTEQTKLNIDRKWAEVPFARHMPGFTDKMLPCTGRKKSCLYRVQLKFL